MMKSDEAVQGPSVTSQGLFPEAAEAEVVEPTKPSNNVENANIAVKDDSAVGNGYHGENAFFSVG